ncbi:MAG TPA: tRNA pseudouridine(38-40) synthase TruA [candidate division Zixibacteria bacterium]|nr:tRNA pseudouridine(38-40) synthase TruA [candidate division Zixibacteria bacterium]
MTKNRFAIKIAYLGENYQGFQRQDETITTIEGAIIETLIELDIITNFKEVRYSAAGRTDAGVNAIAQVISFDSEKEIIHLEELNQNFPEDIYAWGIANVPSDFHARRDAVKRSYRYFTQYNGENIKSMKKGLAKLLGTHNFEKFCKKSDKLPNGMEKSTILTLEEAKVSLLKKNEILVFEFSSKSFLWKQVRKMVSLILMIGKGKYSPNIIDEALDSNSKNPKGGIKPVPPEGLVLDDVIYQNIKFKKIKRKQLIESRIIRKINYHTSKLAVLNFLKKIIL